MSEVLERLVREVVWLRRRVGQLETLEAPKIDLPRLNLLTNGGFEIWQRGVGPFSVSGAYTADRWQLSLETGDALVISRAVGNADVGSAACACAAYTKSKGGSSIQQKITPDVPLETLRGKTLALSLRVKADAPGAACAFLYYAVSGTTTRSAYHTGSGKYETLTLVSTVPIDAPVAVAGVLLDASCTCYIDNAMLVVGDQPAPYAPLHPADEWERCQRYYEVQGGVANGFPRLGGYEAGAATNHQSVGFATRKAVVPVVTKTGTWATGNCGQPGVASPGIMGYDIYTAVTGAGRFQASPGGADSAIIAEANP